MKGEQLAIAVRMEAIHISRALARLIVTDRWETLAWLAQDRLRDPDGLARTVAWLEWCAENPHPYGARTARN